MDDDPDFAAMLKLRLQQHGVDVLHAFAGMEGYRFAFTHEAQAIILDQEMPDGNGEYILRRLKESPVTEGIPVIVLTGTERPGPRPPDVQPRRSAVPDQAGGLGGSVG